MSTTETALRYQPLLLRDTDIPTFSDDAPRAWTRQAFHDRIAKMPPRFRRLLRRSREDPGAILADRHSCEEPGFCLAVFERCESGVARGAPLLREEAHVVEWLALKAQNPHLEHEAEGVKALARQAVGDESGAVRTQRRARDKAFSCCPTCTSGWLFFTGQLILNSGVKGLAEAAVQVLEGGLKVLGGEDPASLGRLQRALARAYGAWGRRRRSVEAAGAALADLPWTTPEADFLDLLHHLGRVLLEGESEHDAAALGVLRRFGARLPASGLAETRRAVSWLRALLAARLGELEDARKRLNRLLDQLAGGVLSAEELALTLDLVLFHCRREHETNRQGAELVLRRLLRRDGLAAELRDEVEAILELVGRRAEAAFDRAAGLRRRLDVRVPALLAARPPATWRPPRRGPKR